MGSVNISIRDEVYQKLRSRRAKGESFSDVLERLLRQPGNLSDFAGIWADIPDDAWRAFRAELEERRRGEIDTARGRARRSA
jgi:predicted CopG family antitoxin